jgi:hypothetical protein
MNNNHTNNHKNSKNGLRVSHTLGRIGLVIGLAGCFSLVLMNNINDYDGFMTRGLVAVAGYAIYILAAE